MKYTRRGTMPEPSKLEDYELEMDRALSNVVLGSVVAAFAMVVILALVLL
jgi:hypothetical protein